MLNFPAGIFDAIRDNDAKLRALRSVAQGKTPGPDGSPRPKVPEAPFRDVPDASLKGTVQALAYGKGQMPPPTQHLVDESEKASMPDTAKAPSQAMLKQGVAPSMSTEGPWGSPLGMPRWSK